MNSYYITLRKLLCKIGIHGDINPFAATRYCPYCEEWIDRL